MHDTGGWWIFPGLSGSLKDPRWPNEISLVLVAANPESQSVWSIRVPSICFPFPGGNTTNPASCRDMA